MIKDNYTFLTLEYQGEQFLFSIELMEKLNKFFNLSYSQILGRKPISKTKIKKIKFVYDYFISKKWFLTKRSKKIGISLCSTVIGKKYSISSETAMNWFKRLIREDFILCSRKNFVPGKYSRRYKLTDTYIEILNDVSGYSDQYYTEEDLDAKRMNLRARESAWESAHNMIFDRKVVAHIAQQYLGSVEQFVVDICKKIPKAILLSPSEYDVRRTRLRNSFDVFNKVMKENGYDKAEWKDFYKALPFKEEDKPSYLITFKYKNYKKSGISTVLKMLNLRARKLKKEGSKWSRTYLKRITEFRNYLRAFKHSINQVGACILKNTRSFFKIDKDGDKIFVTEKCRKYLFYPELEDRFSYSDKDPRDISLQVEISHFLQSIDDGIEAFYRDQMIRNML